MEKVLLSMLFGMMLTHLYIDKLNTDQIISKIDESALLRNENDSLKTKLTADKATIEKRNGI